MNRIIKISFFVLLSIFLFNTGNSFAQLKFGADVYTRYIWRGVDYGNSPSFQPSISYSAGGLTLGTWGAYSFAGSGGNVFAEHDLFASYSISTTNGSFSLLYTDYFYPSASIKYFNYEGNGKGGHVLETGLNYTGSETFPISVSAYYNFYNDVDKSAYLQLEYPITLNQILLSIFAGASSANSSWYGTKDKIALINIGISASKKITITDKFSLPIAASYIINPNIEQTYLIVGISL